MNDKQAGQQGGRPVSYALVVVDESAPIHPIVIGPFETIHDGQVAALDYRQRHSIPGAANIEPTPEENDAWTEAGWYFGIVPIDAPDSLPDPSEPGVPGNDDDRYQED